MISTLIPDPQQVHHAYTTEEDDAYVGQSVMGLGWKQVEPMTTNPIIITSGGHLLHPHLQQQQQQQQLQQLQQPRSTSRTSVYSTTRYIVYI